MNRPLRFNQVVTMVFDNKTTLIVEYLGRFLRVTSAESMSDSEITERAERWAQK